MWLLFNFRKNLDETWWLYHQWHFLFQSRTKAVAFSNMFRQNNYETVAVTEYNIFRFDFYESDKNDVFLSFGSRTKPCAYFLIFVGILTKLGHFTNLDTFRCNNERKLLHFLICFVRIFTKLCLKRNPKFFFLISTKVTRMLSPYRSDNERNLWITFWFSWQCRWNLVTLPPVTLFVPITNENCCTF